jgi:hypothetical protein
MCVGDWYFVQITVYSDKILIHVREIINHCWRRIEGAAGVKLNRSLQHLPATGSPRDAVEPGLLPVKRSSWVAKLSK